MDTWAPTHDLLPLITGREWQRLGPKAQEEYLDNVFHYWRSRGFPYPVLAPTEMARIFQRLILTNSERVFLPDNELQWSNVGLDLANAFHPQIWSVRFARHRSPVDCFADDILLKACLRKALTLWPDRKAASAAVLRDSLRTFTHTRRVSNFRPTVAKALYERYSEVGARILDFSAGYGGRLLGCLTLDRHYVGHDPCGAQMRGLHQMNLQLRKLKPIETKVELRHVCAEEAMLEEHRGSFDLIFTSPPYFDREPYSSETTQSYVRYPTYDEWHERFLKVVISESHRLLRKGGVFILNVADTLTAPIATDAYRVAIELLEHVTTYQLRLMALPFRRNGSAYRHEPVFVFRKR